MHQDGEARVCETLTRVAGRTQQRIELGWKTAKLPVNKVDTMVRYVGNPRGVLSIIFVYKALSGASNRIGFESAPL